MKKCFMFALAITTMLLGSGFYSASAYWAEDGVPATPFAVSNASDQKMIPDGSGGAIIVWTDDRNGNNDIFAQRINASGLRQWSDEGIAICTEGTDHYDLEIIPDGTGGAIITWRDYRNGNGDIYAQRVSSGGAAQWPANGVVICDNPSHQGNPLIVSDGSNGAIITWIDYRFDGGEIFAQRIDSNGIVQWYTNGERLHSYITNPVYQDFDVVSDNLGGAIVTWDAYNPYGHDIYAQRIDDGGNTMWGSTGVPICTYSQSQIHPRIVADGSGGAVIGWRDWRYGKWYIYAQRVDANGITLWQTHGRPVYTYGTNNSDIQMAADGSGGAFFVWRDGRSGNNDIYAQYMRYNGNISWANYNGMPICTATGDQSDPQIIYHPSGWSIFTWVDDRDGNADIYTQRLSANGGYPWAPNGVAICTDGAAQENPQIISDTADGAIIAWHDDRSGNDDIYAQRINTLGTSLWAADGVILYDVTTANQRAARIISDGSGGAIIVWDDYRGGNWDIYTQRIDVNGAVLWDFNALPICIIPHNIYSKQVCSDGSGGAIVTWYSSESGQTYVYGQLIDASGTLQWGGVPSPLKICDHKSREPQCISDDAGGGIIAWMDYRSGNWDIYAQRIDAGGNELWTLYGVAICTESTSQSDVRICEDGSGGAVIVWQDIRNGNWDIYCQRIDASGAVQWTTDGAPVCTHSAGQVSPEIVPDGGGGAIITWTDNRNGNYDIYVRKVASYGGGVWSTYGEPVCTDPSLHSSVRIISDGSGGAIIAWQDDRAGNDDIYGQRINGSNGTPYWLVNGTVVCNHSADQNLPGITADGAGGAIAAWYDHRSGNEDVFVQRIDYSGSRRWAADGEPIVTNSKHQVNPDIASDGAGGALIAWEDKWSGLGFIYAQSYTAPECYLSTTGIDYGYRSILGSYLRSFYIKNDGDAPLNINVSESCDYYSITQGEGSYELSRGQTHNVYILFEPTVEGTHNCSIETGSALCSDVSVTGIGFLCPPDSICYVDADAAGAGDGSSWADAYTDLQDALIASQCDNITEIWVAEGTYKPTDGTLRSAEFGLINGNAIYGGFSGTETMLGQRDFESYVTIMSGDIGVPEDSTDNSYHVVAAVNVDSTTVIDGFTITGGYADGGGSDNNGGGMICQNANPRINNVIFSNNATGSGGHGGGMYCYSTGNPTIMNTVFSHNYTGGGGHGAGIYNDGGNPVLMSVVFDSNSCGSHGGGMFNEGGNPAFTDVTFTNNQATYYSAASGGGLYNHNSTGLLMMNITFQYNASSRYGGGMFNNNAGATLVNVIFDGNTTGERGGGLSSIYSDPWGGIFLYNIIFRNNTTTDTGEDVAGGGLSSADSPLIVSATFYDNVSSGKGGGMWQGGGTATMINTIMWGDSAVAGNEIYNEFDTVTVSHSLIEGCGGSGGGWDPSIGYDGGNNLDADPLFVDAPGGDLQLVAGSPAINAGDNTVANLPSTDLLGNPRIVEGVVDLGAYEFRCFPGSRIYVDKDATGTNDGSSWTDAVTELSAALDAALVCTSINEIWVAEGTYYPTSGSGRSVSFELDDSLSIYGGFAGYETILSERDIENYVTILSGDIGVTGDSTDNSYHVVWASGVDSTTILDGFTITRGQADGGGSFHDQGGGMYIMSSSSLTVSNLRFTHNNAANGGGAMLVHYSDPTVLDVTFKDNYSAVYAGGMHISHSNPTVQDVVFQGNQADNDGGAAFNYYSDPTLINVSFIDNSADHYGGAIYNYFSNPTLTDVIFENNSAVAGGGMHNKDSGPVLINVVFDNNSASGGGGGIYNENGSDPDLYNTLFIGNSASSNGGGIFNETNTNPALTNATFFGNAAGNQGGGMYSINASHPVIVNTIMWGDSASSGAEIFNAGGAAPAISYSLIGGCGGSGGWNPAFGTDGGNNLDGDPRYADPPGGDLRLLYDSPAIDAGDSTAAGLPATDIDINPRVRGLNVDMGAYESFSSFILVTVTTEPPGLEVIVDDSTRTAPWIFSSEEGTAHEIGTITPQQWEDTQYVFTEWGDQGDTTHAVVLPDTHITYTAGFLQLRAYALVDSIADVPGDQGGWLRLHFRRSRYDDAAETQYPIATYGIHRRIDDLALCTAVLTNGEMIAPAPGQSAAREPAREVKQITQQLEGEHRLYRNDDRTFILSNGGIAAAPPGLWEVLGDVPAQQQDHYIYLAATQADSAATIPWSVYYISAHTTTPSVFFDSPPDSGYSVDNIAPGVPQEFMVAYNTGSGNRLSWEPSADDDFQYFKVYRGTDPDFVPGPGNEVHATVDTAWSDPDYDGWDVHYKITALDYVGNESDPASPTTTTGTDNPIIPRAFALYQNVPNPFNPTTMIRFDLPKAVHVSIRVYNIKGELVATLVDEQLEAGVKEIQWLAKDKRGRSVASGIYFYRLIAGDFAETKKMVLLR